MFTSLCNVSFYFFNNISSCLSLVMYLSSPLIMYPNRILVTYNSLLLVTYLSYFPCSVNYYFGNVSYSFSTKVSSNLFCIFLCLVTYIPSSFVTYLPLAIVKYFLLYLVTNIPVSLTKRGFSSL